MISLLITTPGRSQLLAKSLGRLRGLTLPSQLVVVDDSSSEAEELQRITEDFERDTGVPSVYLRHEGSNENCARPRNVGLGRCDRPLVVFSCPEMYFVSDVLAEVAESPPNQITLVGTVYYGEDERDLDRLEELEAPGGGKAIAPYVAMVGAEYLRKIGGWDEGFEGWGGDDIDLMLRLEQIGVERGWVNAKALHQYHGDGGGVELKMAQAEKNSRRLYSKPYMHGHSEHICSEDCLRRLGVVNERP